MSERIALAIAAHPDDIEFMMAGTLLRLRQAGWETHYLNVANGCCGSMTMSRARTRVTRRREARAAARILGAQFHESLVDDLGVYYELKLINRVAAVIREVRPTIVLTHSLSDYMEDHMNTARVAVTATFIRGMPNCPTQPRRAPIAGDTTLYHALPHLLRDPMNRRVVPESFVDISAVQKTKLAALAAHRSQQNWLEASQGMNSYLQTMVDLGREVGRMSRKFEYAEGWRRHNPAGFCAPDADPLQDALGPACRRNAAYARWLDSAP